MIRFDPSQERVLGLDASRHARVLGAPGTGKTRLLAEVYARALELPGWSESEVLALAPNRLAAASLRAGIETRIPHALGGAPARTPASLAFAVLAEAAAATGEPAPRLLTGTVQDEGIAATVERMIESEGATGALVPEVLRSPTFRAELREFWRVLDDFDLDPDALARRLDDARHRAASEAVTEAPDSGLLDRWEYALRLVAEAGRRLAEDRPAELSSSGLIREASRCVNAGRVAPPRLILVDDAQEIGEGSWR
ncbi:UvrD-helicase domain-containing protein [Leucobacter soli]|uniref:UvrD-helicase domain-containing protein n=1 Tax=Leucobacter soli TaxID=2812850 RepID=UPI00360FC8ED